MLPNFIFIVMIISSSSTLLAANPTFPFEYNTTSTKKWLTQNFFYRASQKSIFHESEVTQSCPTLWDPVDCSLSGSSVHGVFQARILERVAISFSRRSSWPRDWTQVSHIVGRRFTVWAHQGSLYSLSLLKILPAAAAAAAAKSSQSCPTLCDLPSVNQIHNLSHLSPPPPLHKKPVTEAFWLYHQNISCVICFFPLASLITPILDFWSRLPTDLPFPIYATLIWTLYSLELSWTPEDVYGIIRHGLCPE